MIDSTEIAFTMILDVQLLPGGKKREVIDSERMRVGRSRRLFARSTGAAQKCSENSSKICSVTGGS